MKLKKEEIKIKIIEAAEKQFFKHGFAKTTTRDLAKAAHVTYGNMYKYFSNKEEILKAVIGTYAYMVYIGFKEHFKHKDDEEFSQKNISGISKGLLHLYEHSRIKFLIFFTGMNGSKIDEIRKKVLNLLIMHINQSVNNLLLARILTENLISAVIRLAKEYDNINLFSESLEKYVRYHISGIKELQ